MARAATAPRRRGAAVAAAAALGWTQLEGDRMRSLRWRGPPPRPTLDAATTPAERAALAPALAAAAAAWQGAPGRHGLRFVAPAPGRTITVAVDRGPWPYGEAEAARTTTRDDGAGGICSARIVLRGVAGGGPALQPVLAHELGHALGLGHSLDRRALMAPGLAADATWAAPQEDDVLALEALYPPAFATASVVACGAGLGESTVAVTPGWARSAWAVVLGVALLAVGGAAWRGWRRG